jgi:phosphate acetyltransferase
MKKKAFFIGSTGQNVGKTTTCLGLLSGFKKRVSDVGFLKPIGQEHVESSSGLIVDKDVILFKDFFELKDPYEMMSPIVFCKGFTKDYLDEKISREDLLNSLKVCFDHLYEHNDLLIVEGTGHLGVGSIVNINNAQVAGLLGLDIILVASGGIGSCFDQIALNKALCDAHGVKIAGVIFNKVLPEKQTVVVEYLKKALGRWNIPLLGVVPYDAFLTNPTMSDYAHLFKTELLAGQMHKLRHFKHIRLVATSNEVYKTLITPSQLVITPASREDVILSTLEKDLEFKKTGSTKDLQAGLILTGLLAPHPSLIKKLQEAKIPTFYTPTNTFNAMKMITSYTAKLRKEDLPRVQEAIELMEQHLDFDQILA